MRLLAGDVGGTNTRLAIFETTEGGFRELRTEKYPSRRYDSLGDIAAEMLRDEAPIDCAAFGIAGPVVEDTCRATNLPWTIDARELERRLGIGRARLLNDFAAIAHGISTLGPDDRRVLQEGEVDPQGPVAILGAGTGLGEAVMLPTAAGPRILASEGGHTDMPPRNELEIDLLRYLLEKHHRVSVERVVSGPGLANIYRFLTERGHETESEEVHAELAEKDPASVIGEYAVRGADPACERAAELFVSLYGAEAGNLALKVLPTGGLYVAGGIAPRLLTIIERGVFLKAFLDKGRMTPLLERTRVSVITDTRVGLLGARNLAASL